MYKPEKEGEKKKKSGSLYGRTASSVLRATRLSADVQVSSSSKNKLTAGNLAFLKITILTHTVRVRDALLPHFRTIQKVSCLRAVLFFVFRNVFSKREGGGGDDEMTHFPKK